MISKTKQDKTIDLAWERLYNRLEQDHLLPAKKITTGHTIFLSSGFKWTASIAILCVCLVTVLLLKQKLKPSENNFLALHNEKNAPTLASTLEDGSVVFLSEQTTIYYPEHFREDRRTVTLSGNAFFEVSKQQERPFVIDTEVAEIEVLGTFFQVKSNDYSSFHLAVRNGEVKVTLKKNHQIIYVNDGETIQLESGRLQKYKSDVHLFENIIERLCFKDERLDDIVRIINLQSHFTPIKIADELCNRRLNFDYSGETPQEIAQLICMALNLKYFQQQNSIFITKDTP